MTPVRLNNRCFTAENAVVAIQSDEEGIGTIGDILNEPGRQMEELAYIAGKCTEEFLTPNTLLTEAQPNGYGPCLVPS